MDVRPESLGAMLEYWYIERGLFSRQPGTNRLDLNFASFIQQLDFDRTVGSLKRTTGTCVRA